MNAATNPQDKDATTSATHTGEKVVLAGGSGFIGSYLKEQFQAEGYRVIVVGRGEGADVKWRNSAALTEAINGAAFVVNIAGKSVNSGHTAAFRKEFLSSRVNANKALASAISAAATPPPLWVNASGAAWYKVRADAPNTESAGQPGTGFLADVTREWERTFFEPPLPATRRVATRMSIVLGKGGGVATPFILLAKLGAGGPQFDGWWFRNKTKERVGTAHVRGPGGGRQKVSWVHQSDVLGVIRFARDTPSLSGSINVTSPDTVDNRTFMATFRRVLHRPIGLPAFRWMIEPAAAVIRTESALLLDSVWIAPERLTEAGYSFAYPRLEPAVRDITGH